MHHARDAEDTRLLELGDHARLLAAYYPVILERCRLRLADPDAYEVAHRVVDRLFGELARGRTYTVPYRVVVFMVTEWKLKEFFTGAREDFLPESWEPTAPDPYEPFEQRFDIEVLLAGLPERPRQAFTLRYLDGLDIDEIAVRLGIERNAVDQALHRGLVRLRETIHD